LIESIFTATIYYSWTNHIYLYILPLYSQNFVFDLLNELVFRQRNSIGIISVFIKCILNRFFFDLYFFLRAIFVTLFLAIFSFIFLWFHLFIYRWSSCILSTFFSRRGWCFFFNFSRRVTPSHDITDKYKNFVIFKRFLHGLDAKLNIAYFSLIETIYVDFAFFNGFFSE